MNEIDASSLLAQMRALAARAQGVDQAVQPETDKAGFSNLLKQAVDQVNSTQKQAGALAEAFEQGDPDVNVAEVMIALQKADVSFQAITQVRNRLVSAYQDIMNMPV